MRAIIFVVVSAYAVYSMGAFPKIKIKNVSGDYLDEKGQAHAETAKYSINKVKISHQDIFINFNKKQKNLVLKDNTTTVQLDFDFSFLNVFKAFSFKLLDIDSDSKVFSFGSENLDLYILPKKYQLSNVFLQTDVTGISLPDDEDISIVDGLVLNAGFSIDKIEFAKIDEDFFDEIRIENPMLVDDVTKIQRKGAALEFPIIIRNVDYEIKKGFFRGMAKIDSYINLWFHIAGDIKTDKKNTYLKINIQKAKLGIFSIRNTIMNMIRRLKLDGVTVEGRTVIIDLENVVSIN